MPGGRRTIVACEELLCTLRGGEEGASIARWLRGQVCVWY